MKLYLDSSALVKLVQAEPESPALRGYLTRHQEDERATSALARVEVVRAVRAGGPAAVTKARRQLHRLYLVALDIALLDAAAALEAPALLRTVDAIHVASARRLEPDLRAIVTYDQRMSDACEAMGLRTAAPGAEQRPGR